MREIIRFAWGISSLGDFVVAMSEKGLGALEFSSMHAAMEDALRIRFPEAELERSEDGLAAVMEVVAGVIDDPATDVRYLDVTLAADARFTLPLSDTHHAFVYVFEGSARLAGEDLATHTLAVLGTGDTVDIQAGAAGARFILVAGRPIGEPVVQYGPFVMNTRVEIEQAFADYQAGRLVQARATMTGH